MNASAAGATIGICLHDGGDVNGMNPIKATRENTYNNHTLYVFVLYSGNIQQRSCKMRKIDDDHTLADKTDFIFHFSIFQLEIFQQKFNGVSDKYGQPDTTTPFTMHACMYVEDAHSRAEQCKTYMERD